jgi:hypothetical protein
VSLDVGTWEGPIAPGYGLHLVLVTDRAQPGLSPLSDIRDAVTRELMADRREEADRSFYGALRDRYEVIVEDTSAKPRQLAKSEPDQ